MVVNRAVTGKDKIDMKIMITATGEDLGSALDGRFGRAKCFLLMEEGADGVEVRTNEQNLRAAQGAGIQAAQQVIDAGADVLISGHVGPKAFQVLQAGGVKVYLAQAGTVGDVLEQFRRGELDEIAGADVEGHWV